MPSPSQAHEVSQEITAQFDLQGKFGISVDEMVAPVKIAAPYEGLVLGGSATGWSMAHHTFTPTLGENAALYLYNPVGSGMIAKVSSVVIFTGGATWQAIRMGVRNEDVGVKAGTRSSTDGRTARPLGLRTPTLELREHQQATAWTNRQFVSKVNEEQTQDFRPEGLYLIPGYGWYCQHAVGGTTINGNFEWMERPLRASEREALGV